jgi:hypothetical protein
VFARVVGLVSLLLDVVLWLGLRVSLIAALPHSSLVANNRLGGLICLGLRLISFGILGLEIGLIFCLGLGLDFGVDMPNLLTKVKSLLGEGIYDYEDIRNWCSLLPYDEFMEMIEQTPIFMEGSDKVYLMSKLSKRKNQKFVGIEIQSKFCQYWDALRRENVQFRRTNANSFSFARFDRVYSFNPFGRLGMTEKSFIKRYGISCQ